jgi:hypothetical protein
MHVFAIHVSLSAVAGTPDGIGSPSGDPATWRGIEGAVKPSLSPGASAGLGRFVRARGSGGRRSRVPAIDLASGEVAAYISFVALLFESGPFFVSLQASNPVPYPIAAVRPVMRVRVAERRYMEQLHVKRYG